MTPDMWIRSRNAFDALVARELFEAAQAIIASRAFRLSDEEMLASLKGLYHEKGLLSGIVIDECDGLASSSAYASRFGSLLRAYSLVGYTPDRDYRYLAINRRLRELHPSVLEGVLTNLSEAGCSTSADAESDQIIVNEEFTLSVVIARCFETPAGLLRWKLRFDTSSSPDITVVVRMDRTNTAPFDFYMFPRMEALAEKVRLAEDNNLRLDAYRFDTRDLLYAIAAPVPLPEVA